MNALSRDDSSGHRSTIKRYLVEHYDQLHNMAARQMAKENPDNSMQATALLHEVVCKMLDRKGSLEMNDSKHFLATANLMMKHILVDHARRRNTLAHGGDLRRKEMNNDYEESDHQLVKLLILQEEIQLLARQDPQAAHIIEKRYQGYSIDEVADQLKMSRSQAYDKWNCGRAWLLHKFNHVSSQTD